MKGKTKVNSNENIFLKQINKNSKKGGQLETFYKSCSFAILP